jgi:hypothetical protein
MPRVMNLLFLYSDIGKSSSLKNDHEDSVSDHCKYVKIPALNTSIHPFSKRESEAELVQQE